jgi:DNA polymerase-3 subunit chi
VADASPCEVWFYHLEQATLDRVMPELLEKTLARGWRAIVRAAGQERIEHLDGRLWAWKDDSFLPHGLDGEPDRERQPVLLTTDMGNPNGAQALFILDGAECGPLDGFSRCILLFDGRDEAAVAEARKRWKAFASLGLPTSYWRQNERGGWEKKA